MYVEIKEMWPSDPREYKDLFKWYLHSPDFLSLPVEADRTLVPGLADSHERLLCRISSSFFPPL
jgi:hypothetical protein